MERKQFTFYESFYRAMRKITDATVRGQILDAICAYALYGRVPKENKVRPETVMMFEMARPVLDTARKKAEGASGKEEDKTEEGQKKEKSKKKVREKKDGGKEKEKEVEIENEIERESEGGRERFEIFWNQYPKKVDKDGARVAFQGVQEELQVLLDALENHKRSAQWLEDGGRFIPRAAQWLSQQRWLEKLTKPSGKVPMGASGEMGEAELAAIQRMLTGT